MTTLETPFMSSCMRSLCGGRKQRCAPPPKSPARVVDLSLLPNIVLCINSALFSSFTASLACIFLSFVSCCILCTVWLHNRLSNRLHIHTDTSNGAEPHLSFIAIDSTPFTPHSGAPPQWFSSRISSTFAKRKSVLNRIVSALLTGSDGGPTRPKGNGLQVSLRLSDTLRIS